MLKLDVMQLLANRIISGIKQAHLEKFVFSITDKEELSKTIPSNIKSAINKKSSGFLSKTGKNTIYIMMRPKDADTQVQTEELRLSLIKLVKAALFSDTDNGESLETSVVDVNLNPVKEDDTDKKQDARKIMLFAGFELDIND